MCSDLIEQLSTISASYTTFYQGLSTALKLQDVKPKPKPKKKLLLYTKITTATSLTARPSPTVSQSPVDNKPPTDISLTPSGLAALLSLPSLIEVLSNLQSATKTHSIEGMFEKNKRFAEHALVELRKALALEACHDANLNDNWIRLLFNFPQNKIKTGDYNNLFEGVSKHILSISREDALDFHARWLASRTQQKLIDSFKRSLKQRHSLYMPSPLTSLFEVAVYLSVLDPKQDSAAMGAFSQLFCHMLKTYKQDANQNQANSHSINDTATSLIAIIALCMSLRAPGNKTACKPSTEDTPAITALSLIATSGLIDDIKPSEAVRAVLFAKCNAKTLSILRDLSNIKALAEAGLASPKINQALAKKVLEPGQHHNLAADALSMLKQDAERYRDLSFEHIKQMNRLMHELSEQQSILKSHPEYKKASLENRHIYRFQILHGQGLLEHVLQDEGFLAPLNAFITKQMSVDKIFNRMRQIIYKEQLDNPAQHVLLQGNTQQLQINYAKMQVVDAICHMLQDPKWKALTETETNKVQFMVQKVRRSGLQSTALTDAKLQLLEKKYLALNKLKQELVQSRQRFDKQWHQLQKSEPSQAKDAAILEAIDTIALLQETGLGDKKKVEACINALTAIERKAAPLKAQSTNMQ